MAKRRNENGQMRREDYEAADADGDYQVASDSFDIGFQRASEDSIRKRKIVKARVGGSRPPVAAKPKLAAPAAAGANPFSGFQGLAAETKSASANPFAGFSGLTGATNPPVAAKTLSSIASAAINCSKPSAGSYQEAMEGLNKAFLTFVNGQAKENPGASWIAAIQDYLKYASEIGVKHASTKPVGINEQSKRATPAPFSFAAAPAPDSSASLIGPSSTTAAAPSSSSFSFSGTSAAPKTKIPEPAKTPASSSNGGFSFSSGGSSLFSSKATESEEKVVPAFSFGGLPKPSAAAPSPSGGFSFGNLTAPKPSTTTTPPASSGLKPFSFGASAPAASTAVPSSAAVQDEDEETVGREEATVILKADTPDDECTFEAEKAKVFEFKNDEKRWADKGVHPLKVLVNKETKSARILVRNEIGKIVLNSSLYKGLTVRPHEVKGKKTGVTLALQVEGGSMAQFLLKVNAARVDEFVKALEAAAGAS